MTPIDTTALLAMLIAFYPSATAGELARAMNERPEYFAASRQVGAMGDQILVPDGRTFDLIYHAGATDGSARWQVITPSAGGEELNATGFEPGALVPITIDAVLPPLLAPPFAELGGAWLAQVQGHEWAIGGHVNEIAGAADPGNLEAIFTDAQTEGGYALHNQIRTLGELDPWDGEQATNDRGGVIADAQNDYPDPEQSAPPDIPVEPNPDQEPPGEEGGEPWVDTEPWRQRQA